MLDNPSLRKRALRVVINALPDPILKSIVAAVQGSLVRDPAHTGFLQKIYWNNEADRGGLDPRRVFPPSKEMVMEYEHLLRGAIYPKRILILGATPEVRDAVARICPDAEAYICDFSWKMLFSTTARCVVADPDKERWVKTDWLSMPFPPDFFDVAIGDLVLTQLAANDRKILLRRVGEVLRDNGVFITRMRTRRGGELRSLATKVIADTFKTFSEKKDGRRIVAGHLLRRLVLISAKDGTDVPDLGWIRDMLLAHISGADSGARAAMELASEFTKIYEERMPVRLRWDTPTREELIKIFSAEFSVDLVREFEDCPEISQYGIFQLRRRKSIEIKLAQNKISNGKYAGKTKSK